MSKVKLATDPRGILLSKRSITAVARTWTPKMIKVGDVLAMLPPKAGNGYDETLMNAWGFIFAIDALRNNAPAIQVLLEVIDTFTERPQHQEVFQIVDRLLAFKVEWKTSLKNHTAPGPRTSGKVGFVRRR